MPIYLEQSVGGVQVENSNMDKEDENCEIQKPQMQSTKDGKHMINHVINIILIFDLQMTNKFVSNNYKSEAFGMQRSKDDLSRVLVESIEVFAQSSGVFAQTLNLLENSIIFLVQSIDVLPQLVDELTYSTDKWAQLAKGI